jgi:hypothetical protein
MNNEQRATDRPPAVGKDQHSLTTVPAEVKPPTMIKRPLKMMLEAFLRIVGGVPPTENTVQETKQKNKRKS